MTPLRLQFEGFARFAGQQVISFEDLELFAITGPTGAGKTLILDALSFALYGVTARQSRMVDSLINVDSQRLAVELQFEAASGTYRVVRVMERRASGTVSKSARLEELADGKWKRITETDKLTELNAKIISIIGLDFAAFTRSILLPQGKFDEFLHGEARQRRELLKELLGLTRVDSMREEAGKRERASAARAEALSAQLEADGLAAAAERRRELKAELSELARELATATGRLEEERKVLAEAEEIAQLHAELQQLEDELRRQQEAARIAPDLRTELERGLKAAALAPLIRHAGLLSGRLRAAEAELARSAAELPELQRKFADARNLASQAETSLETSEPELNRQIEVLQTLLPYARRLERLGGAPAGVSAEAARFSEDRLEELQEFSGQAEALEAAAERAETARSAQERAATEARQAREAAARLADELAALVPAGQESAARLDRLRQELARAELHAGEHVHALRANLEVGEACPVCGHSVSSLPEPQSGELEPLRSRMQEAEQNHVAMQDRFREIRDSIRGQELLAGTHGRMAEERQEELERAGAALAALQERFEAAGFTGPAAQIRSLLKAQLQEQLAALAAMLHAGSGGAEPAAKLQEVRAELAALRESQRQAGAALAAAERAFVQASGLEQLRQEAVNEQQASLAEHERELARQLQAAGFGTAEEAGQAERSGSRLTELEQQLEQTTRELTRLQARQLELTAAIRGRPDSREQLSVLRAGVRQLESDLHGLRERRGGLQADLSTQEQLVERSRELTEQRRLHEEQHSLWRQLALDLQENRFTDFLLKGLQKRLAHHASRIIRQVTGDRFDLHLSDGGEFEVSDAWAGGERRSARSLSGGETFIVSLALALALSDAAGGGRRLGALFLDEGFGTLDAVTLDSVAAVLEGLSGEGRLVGIITHVTELADRLPARLVVRKEAEGSSVYWEG